MVRISKLDRILAVLNKDKEVTYLDLEGSSKKTHMVKGVGWITLAALTGRVYATTNANLFVAQLPIFKEEGSFIELYKKELEIVEWDQKK